jgi:Raf kinase inhibitor-like YbhB/YbcL family protein
MTHLFPKDPMPFRVASRAFKEGESIPAHYTRDGEDVSPPLDWFEPPVGTKSFALVCEDADAPSGGFTHWVIYNIPPTVTLFPEAFPPLNSLPNGIKQGMNSFGQVGYSGPSPLKGLPHRYFFKIYALNTVLELDPGAAKAQLEKTMQRRIVGEAQLMGKYQRS